MPSQFFGLYIAGSGLRSANAALNTTANNIANTQTVGYSRQQVVQEANNPLRTFTTYGSAGAGVDVLAIERIRDHFFDVKFWNNHTRLGKYEVQQYYMRTLEDYFEDDGMSGFNTLFNRMFGGIETLTLNASSTSTKADFISSVKALTDYFNNMYGNLQEMQNDLNLEIKQTIDEINSIAEKVAILNRQINVIEMGGGTANELRDQREKLIDRLSNLVDVEVDERPIFDINDPTRLTGGTHYTVKINGGQTLTNGNEYNQLLCMARRDYEKVNQTDIDGLFDVRWQNGNDFGLQSAVMGGRLRGLVEMRDGNNGFYFGGNQQSVYLREIDHYYEGTTRLTDITVNVTDVNLMDMRLCNLSDAGGKITIGGQAYYYSSWEYLGTDTNGETSYSFTLDYSRHQYNDIIGSSLRGAEVAIGRSVEFQGVPYYMTQMNAWLRGFAEQVNLIFHGEYTTNATAGGEPLFLDADGLPTFENTGTPFLDKPGGDQIYFIANGFDNQSNPGALFFTGRHPIDGQYTATDLLGWTGNGLYEITAGNITIVDELMRNADRLGSKSDPGVGNEECEQVKKLSQLLNSKEMFSFRNGTAKDFLEMILGDVALNASNANTFFRAYKGLSNAIDNQRSSVSGVDEDEEAVNLVKYQHAYNLSSRMIQTLTEIYNRLILQTGV